MNVIALTAPVGGAGRTTLTAELASLLVARGHAVLAIECDPHNVLGLHFGLRMPAEHGLARYADDPSPTAWAAAALRSDDGVLFVPWGAEAAARAALTADPAVAGGSGEQTVGTGRPHSPLPLAGEGSGVRADDAATRRLLDDPHWLRELLAQLALPDDALVLIDSPSWPSPHARQALAAADLALVVVPLEPTVCATLPRMQRALVDAGIDHAVVATRVQPSRQLHADVLALLRSTLGDAMLPYQVHADTGVPDALARGESFCRSTPHSQAAHDLQGIAAWLSHWAMQRVSESAQAGTRRERRTRR